MDHNECELPDTLEGLLKLPGLGEYGARAVMSFGNNRPYAVVDSNVERILTRLFSRSIGGSPRPDFQMIADMLLTTRFPQRVQLRTVGSWLFRLQVHEPYLQ